LTKVAYATEENIRLSAIWQTWLKLDEGQGQFNRTGPVGPKIFLKIFNFHGILFCIYVDKFLVSAYWTSHPSKIPHPQKLKSFPLYLWQFYDEVFIIKTNGMGGFDNILHYIYLQNSSSHKITDIVMKSQIWWQQIFDAVALSDPLSQRITSPD